MTPLLRSWVTASIVDFSPKAMVSASMPGHQELLVVAAARTAIPPPRKYANISSIITGKTRPTTTCTGCRAQWASPRRVMVQESVTRVMPLIRSSPSLRRHTVRARSVVRAPCRAAWLAAGPPRPAGEVQEHLVQGRAAQRDVLRLDPGRLQRPYGLGERRHPVGDRGAEPAGGPGRPTDARPRRQRRTTRPARGQLAGVAQHDVDAVAADPRPSARRPCPRRRTRPGRPPRCGRRAGRPPPGTGWSAGPSYRRRPGSGPRPTPRCGRAGRARWSARPGRAPRGVGDQARRPGRAGAACRRCTG